MTLLCGTGVGVDALLEMFKARAPTVSLFALIEQL